MIVVFAHILLFKSKLGRMNFVFQDICPVVLKKLF